MVPIVSSASRHRSESAELVDIFGVQLGVVERRQLAHAIDHRLPVTITYRSQSGGITSRTISRTELVNGQLLAWCHLRDDERMFFIDRVQSVSPVRG